MSRGSDLRPLLEHVDNPANEDRWGLACFIADRAGISRRSVSQKLVALEAAGFVESTKPSGPRSPGGRSDAPPRLWRRKLT
jgi:DNA-binding transcriptional ArsR family regulator